MWGLFLLVWDQALGRLRQRILSPGAKEPDRGGGSKSGLSMC